MAEMLSQVEVGFGSVVRVGVGPTPTWTQLYGLETVTMPSQPPEDIDVTHQQSPGRTRETRPGLKAVADWSLEMQYWAGSDTDVLLEGLAEQTDAGEPTIVLLEITVYGGSPRTFQAYLNEYLPSSPIGEKQMVTANWKVMARVLGSS